MWRGECSAIPNGVRALAITFLGLASLTAPLAACWSRSPARSPEPAAEAPGERLVAARSDGIFELSRDGRELRKLSSTHASAMRWLVPQERLLILTEETGELRALELATGAERVVARVRTTLACAAPADVDPVDAQVRLDVQDDSDFTVGPTHACLTLMDRNANMASYRVEVRVDLTTGTSTEDFTIAPPECQLPQREQPGCARYGNFASEAPAGASSDAEPPHEFAGPPGFTISSWSPSRRWVLLQGNESIGDYIHSQIVLYEVATRRTFPLLGDDVAALGGARWPAPLTAAQLALAPEELAPLVGDVVGETPIYWLAGRDDRLVVEDRLVLPGARVLQVGRLAR